ncbi:MAG: inositol monophosphatase family protein [Proteobacteria bacterium]|nr:inositol monophosphatase family protein [Pseudomonadota bacterium]
MVRSSQTPKSALINVMSQAVYKAARGIVRDFGELSHLQITRKSIGDFVSSADKRSEQILIDELRKARPTFGFLCEEAGEISGRDDRHRWIIDPLDGTTNFLHSNPHFAINLALEFDNEIIAGVTYQPILDELFWAEKGKGAFCNQKRLRVSGRRDMESLLICCSHDDPAAEKIKGKISGLRYTGAGALDLAYVAAGRFDVCFLEGLKPWDMAAGILLVREAGGVITNTDGKPLDIYVESVLCANEFLHKEFLPLVK